MDELGPLFALIWLLFPLLSRMAKSIFPNEEEDEVGLIIEEARAERTEQLPRVPLDRAQIDQLKARAEGVRQRLRRSVYGTVLVEVIEQSVLPGLDEAQAILEEDEDEAGIIVASTRRSLSVLQEIERIRQGPFGAHLADAETLSEALLQPFNQLAQTEPFVFAKHRPVCVPAAPDQESLWLGLLPPGYPVIFVPRDFGENLYRWASLPHEIGHLALRKIPGFEAELREALDLEEEGYLFDPRESADILQPFSAWLEEIVADAFAVMLLGPAGMRGLVECFSSPDDVNRVLWAGADGELFAPHPPAHLRVLWAGHLLRTIGYDVELRGLLDAWTERHGEPEHVILPVVGGTAAMFPVAFIADVGRQLVDRIYAHGFRALAGRELRSVHGLELSPGAWSRAQGLIAPITLGEPVRSEARSVLVAAIEAYARAPHAKDAIRGAVTASILGRDAGERRPVDQAYAIRSKEGLHSEALEDVRAALILHEVLERRPFRG